MKTNESRGNEIEIKGSNIWTPEEIGDEIRGVIVFKNLESTYGLQMTIETADGTRYATPCHKVLQARLSYVEIGDRVRIVYDGEVPPAVRGNNPTKLYKLFKVES